MLTYTLFMLGNQEGAEFGGPLPSLEQPDDLVVKGEIDPTYGLLEYRGITEDHIDYIMQEIRKARILEQDYREHTFDLDATETALRVAAHLGGDLIVDYDTYWVSAMLEIPQSATSNLSIEDIWSLSELLFSVGQDSKVTELRFYSLRDISLRPEPRDVWQGVEDIAEIDLSSNWEGVLEYFGISDDEFWSTPALYRGLTLLDDSIFECSSTVTIGKGLDRIVYKMGLDLSSVTLKGINKLMKDLDWYDKVIGGLQNPHINEQGEFCVTILLGEQKQNEHS